MYIENVTLDLPSATVTVGISHPKVSKFPCPVCSTENSIQNRQKRRWRHLDTCGFTTILEAEVSKIQCSEHEVKQVKVLWEEPGSRFMALFEAIAISLLKVASFSDVARHLRISWDAASGIIERAVREILPDGEQKICFCRFHVAQYFNKALGKVHAEKHRDFKKRGEKSPLKRTKHA